jgi:hypothetical protein
VPDQRAWGLAAQALLPRSFNFELQCSRQDAIILSLGASTVSLWKTSSSTKPATAEQLLVRAVLDAPMFGTGGAGTHARAGGAAARGGGRCPRRCSGWTLGPRRGPSSPTSWRARRTW